MSPQALQSEEAKKRFFDGMSLTAATVSVVTTDGPAGRAGVTVSAMSSVSADTPRPTLLVCINEASSAADAILENGVICVNVLRDSQAYISDSFAGRYKDRLKDKFDCTQWDLGVTGAPRVSEALVAFDCKIVSIEKIGTHHVCFGEVQETYLGKQGTALIYANRGYGASSRLDPAVNADFGSNENGGMLRIGCFHTFGPFMAPRLIAALKKAAPDIALKIIEGDNRRLKEALAAGEIDIALMYAFDEGENIAMTDLIALEPYILMAQGHPLADRAEIVPSDLEGEPMIGVAESASSERLEGLLTKAGVKPNIVHRSASIEMVRGMVGHGLGFAIMMTKPASAVTYDGMALVSRPLKVDEGPGRVVLAEAASAEPNGATTLFKALARRLFRDSDAR